MTETISLIAVVVMAWLLWREHRKRNEAEDDANFWEVEYMALRQNYLSVHTELTRLTDRDEKGRFVKREKGSAV